MYTRQQRDEKILPLQDKLDSAESKLLFYKFRGKNQPSIPEKLGTDSVMGKYLKRREMGMAVQTAGDFCLYGNKTLLK